MNFKNKAEIKADIIKRVNEKLKESGQLRPSEQIGAEGTVLDVLVSAFAEELASAQDNIENEILRLQVGR